jgi:Heterokaryon incompatibility protein (HET)
MKFCCRASRLWFHVICGFYQTLEILSSVAINTIAHMFRYIALKRLRHLQTARTLWVDAVCINQRNLEEKPLQLLLMNKIYSFASRVLCWLGEDTDEKAVAQALKLVEKIGHVNFNSLTRRAVNPQFMREHNLPEPYDQQWEFLISLWKRPWFQRAWIVQEFLSGSEVRFICGLFELEWRVLASGIGKLLEYRLMDWGVGFDPNREPEIQSTVAGSMQFLMMTEIKGMRSWDDMLSNIIRSFSERDETSVRELEEGVWSKFPGIKETVKTLRSSSDMDSEAGAAMVSQTLRSTFNMLGMSEKTQMKLPLPKLLRTFEKSLSTDPRDKVFAFLAISRDADAAELKPSYSESVETIFTRYARYFLLYDDESTAMSILCQSGYASQMNLELNLPSWVPDWTNTKLSEDCMISLGSQISFAYKAAGTTKPKIRLTNELHEIYVKGGSLGTVKRIVVSAKLVNPSMELGDDLMSHATPESVGKELILNLRRYFSEVDDMFMNRKSPYPLISSTESNLEVQWRTLMGNLDMRSFAPDKSTETLYVNFRGFLYNNDVPRFDYIRSVISDNDWARRWFPLTMDYVPCELSSGLFGLAPFGTDVGDEVYILLGGNVAFALRPGGSQKRKFYLIGGTYIHGRMHGEAFKTDNWKEEEICII